VTVVKQGFEYKYEYQCKIPTLHVSSLDLDLDLGIDGRAGFDGSYIVTPHVVRLERN
jgi:hypothetical protein